jgi:hypothetical protein
LNLKEFATLSGVVVVRCEKDDDEGTWAYMLKGQPDTIYCGYRNEKHLYRSWLKENFGADCSEAIKKLLVINS